MTRMRLDYVHEFFDRHGKLRRCVRRRGFRKIPLPGLPGSSEFMAAYQDALTLTSPAHVSKHGPGSLSALAMEFYRSAEFANLKTTSQKTYRLIIDLILRKDGHRLVRDMPADKARKIIQEIGETRPGMANLTQSVMRRMMAHAITLGWRKDNPFAGLKAHKLGTHHTWTDVELASYEKRWRLGTREHLAYAILLYTGQRVGDVVRMRRSDIVNGAIKVIQGKVRKGTTSELMIPIHPPLDRALKAGPANGLWLIGDKHGCPITRTTLSVLIAEAAGKAGLPPICKAHGLRKAALRRLAEAGASSKQIAAVSGHRTLAMIEHYTREADQKRLAQDAIGMLPDKS